MAQGVASDFSKCPNHMRGADLRGASLGRSKFDGVDLSFAIFDHADVHGSTFYDTKLENASFLGANLAKANFFTANLRGANFTGATLTEADMTSAEMGPGTTFRSADMTRCQIKSVGHGPQSAVGVVFDGRPPSSSPRSRTRLRRDLSSGVTRRQPRARGDHGEPTLPPARPPASG